MTRAQQIGVIVGLVIVAMLTTLRASDPPLLRQAREVAFDEYQRIAPRTFQDMPVHVVDIDEASLRQFGQWPWPRDRMARLVDRLSAMGASAIAFDIPLSEPDRSFPRTVVRDIAEIDPSLLARLPDNDEIFAQAIAGNPVVLGFALDRRSKPSRNEGRICLYRRAALQRDAAHTQRNAATAAACGQCRRPRAYQPDARRSIIGGAHRALAPQRRRTALSQPCRGSIARRAGRIHLICWPTRPTCSDTITRIKIGEFVVPVTAAGELWLHVTPDNAGRYISVRDLLTDGDVAAGTAAKINGSIVFVGTSAAGLQDIRTTALGENVPGVSLQAQIVEQILSGHFLSRPDWADGLEILSHRDGGQPAGLPDHVSQSRSCTGLRAFDHSPGSGCIVECVRLWRASLRSAGANRQRVHHPFRRNRIPLPGD